jgi:hypothetical protein
VDHLRLDHGAEDVDQTGIALARDGMYWTASNNDSATAPFYNFGKNGERSIVSPRARSRWLFPCGA